MKQYFMVSLIAVLFHFFQFTPQNNPEPWRGSNISAGAHVFAITTFNTLIYFSLHGGQRLYILDMDFLIFINNNPGVEDVLRIDGLLDALHHFINFTAPFRFYKGCHVAARSMLCL